MNKRKWLLVLTGVATAAVLAFGSVAIYAHGPLGYGYDSESGEWWNDEGVCYVGGGFCNGGYGAGSLNLAHPALLATMADTIGITYDELTTELVAGKTIAAIADENGVSAAALSTAILEPYNANLDARVAAGYLTAAEAAAISEQAQAAITTQLTTPLYLTTPAAATQGGWGHSWGGRWGRGCFR